ncbi:MAG: NAD(P)H-dependent oxidoreductase [Pseudomonadota bacterium]|nr:NAD(P)H-dependent oxidoreductase [Pseudomonadota bacterium]
MRFLIFAASHRPESVNRKLAKLAARQLQASNLAVDFAEYREFDLPLYNDDIYGKSGVPASARIFGERAAGAQGIVISSPEYNWSYPGTLKNILDWTSRMKPNPLAGKTALLMSATPGSRGGIVGLTHLKTPLEAMQIFVFPKVFPLGYSEKAFTDADALADARQRQRFEALVEEYIGFTRKLSNGG